jgi:hypothetical protein
MALNAYDTANLSQADRANPELNAKLARPELDAKPVLLAPNDAGRPPSLCTAPSKLVEFRLGRNDRNGL